MVPEVSECFGVAACSMALLARTWRPLRTRAAPRAGVQRGLVSRFLSLHAPLTTTHLHARVGCLTPRLAWGAVPASLGSARRGRRRRRRPRPPRRPRRRRRRWRRRSRRRRRPRRRLRGALRGQAPPQAREPASRRMRRRARSLRASRQGRPARRPTARPCRCHRWRLGPRRTRRAPLGRAAWRRRARRRQLAPAALRRPGRRRPARSLRCAQRPKTALSLA